MGIFVLFVSLLIGLFFWYSRLPGENGLGYYTSAEEAIRPGVVLTNKNIIITGGYRGIGIPTVQVLAKLKPNIWLPARPSSMDDCIRVAESIRSSTDNPNIFCEEMDFSSFKSVKKFATQWKELNQPLHILILNAGVGMGPFQKTEDGFQYIWQCNHLGQFLLTNLLMDNLKAGAPSRVVVVSSDAHRFTDIIWDDISGEGTWYDTSTMNELRAYAQSKTANNLFAKKLNQLLKGFGTTYTLHPGGILTTINKKSSERWLLNIVHLQLALTGKTPEQGAATTVYAATAPELGTIGGVYLDDCQIISADYMTDESAERLWQLSLQSITHWVN